MAFIRTRTAPSPYPRLIFHGLRIGQALASLVVGGIMFYFIHNLRHESYDPPKTFWVLLASSLLSLILLVGTLVVYVCFGLSPLINLIGNTVLLALWAPGFAFLCYYSGATLGHMCNKANWNGPVGISICRTYKTLFSFALLGVLTTLASVILDVITWRRTTARGKYMAANASGEKPLGISAPLAPYAAQGYSDSRSSIALEQYTAPNTERDANSGYAVPEEQFSYGDTDTAYHGGHEPEPVSALAPKK